MKQGWTYKKLGELVKVINGLWVGKKPPFTNVAVVRNANFTKSCTLDMSNIAYIDVEEKQFNTRELQYADIIIEKSGGSEKQPVGRPVFFNIKDRGYSFSNFTATLRVVSSDIVPEYLYKVLLAQYKQGVTKRLQSKTTGLHNLNFKSYLKSVIPIPPLSTQQSIVVELDKINELIRLKKEQLKDYDNLAQSIFYEMFGDPIENEKGWEVKKLGDVCEVSSFKRVLVEDVLEKGPVPFIRGTELSAICKENKREYKMYITMEHYERVKNISGVPNVGDLLIPSINAEGLVWVVDTPEPMYYKDGRVLWVHVDQNSISSIALQRILNNLIKDNYSKITNGAVFAELNLSILRSFPIILPPLSIQNAFANKINLIEKQKAEIQSTIADLETLLASRMQYWFD